MLLNGRVVVNAEIEGVDMSDYPDFCDAYFSYAEFEDNGAKLTDDELEELTDCCSDTLSEMAIGSIF